MYTSFPSFPSVGVCGIPDDGGSGPVIKTVSHALRRGEGPGEEGGGADQRCVQVPTPPGPLISIIQMWPASTSESTIPRMCWASTLRERPSSGTASLGTSVSSLPKTKALVLRNAPPSAVQFYSLPAEEGWVWRCSAYHPPFPTTVGTSNMVNIFFNDALFHVRQMKKSFSPDRRWSLRSSWVATSPSISSSTTGTFSGPLEGWGTPSPSQGEWRSHVLTL